MLCSRSIASAMIPMSLLRLQFPVASPLPCARFVLPSPPLLGNVSCTIKALRYLFAQGNSFNTAMPAACQKLSAVSRELLSYSLILRLQSKVMECKECVYSHGALRAVIHTRYTLFHPCTTKMIFRWSRVTADVRDNRFSTYLTRDNCRSACAAFIEQVFEPTVYRDERPSNQQNSQ